MSPNVRRVKKEWAAYMSEVEHIIIPDLKDAPLSRKPHKFHAFTEEFFDKCPRIASYIIWPLLLVLAYA